MTRDFSPTIERRLREVALNAGSDLLIDGLLFSPAFTALSLLILEQARENDVENIFFFAREGILLNRVFNKVSGIYPACGSWRPNATVLHVSRLATFFPSLRSLSTDELMRVWSQYPKMSLATLFHTFGFFPDNLSETFQRHELTIDTSMKAPWSDPKVKGLFSDPSFVVPVQKEILKRRSLLTEYLVRCGVQNSGSCMVVDLGWRGSIQDNLASLFRNNVFHGVYFGLLPELNIRAPNVTKMGLLPGSANVDLETFIEPLEFICNADFGSVTGYERNASTGSVEPIHSHVDTETEAAMRAIKHFQEGVILGVPHVLDHLGSMRLEFQELSLLALTATTRLKESPSPSLARAWFSSRQSDVFGTGRIKQRETLSVRRWYDNFLPFSTRRLKKRFRKSGWPECALTLFNSKS